MAQFIGIVEGSGAEVHRLGSKVSGLMASIRGWRVGVSVIAENIAGKDVIRVYRTGGSNDPGSKELLAEVSE